MAEARRPTDPWGKIYTDRTTVSVTPPSQRRRPGMLYLKATAVGLVAAFLSAAAWVVGAMLIPFLWQWWSERCQGWGVGAVSIGSGSILLAGLMGFMLGFAWIVRRS